MADAFSLQLPIEPPYRALVPELAGRYAELLGGSAAEAAAFTDAVVAAMARVTAEAGPDGQLDLRFKPNGAGIHVELACHDRRAAITVPLAVAKSS